MPAFRSLCLLALLIMSGINGFAQIMPDTTRGILSDSVRDKKQEEYRERTKVVPLVPTADGAPSIVQKKEPYQPKPKKSALYSAIMPGLGQINNREYWKVPVIYVGVGAAAYFLIDNTKQYRRYRKAYVERLGNPNYHDEFTDLYPNNPNLPALLKSNQDTYKKWLDMTYLYTGVGYLLQIVDALAFAHLKNFDISKDLSLRFEPVTMPEGAGMGFVIHIR